MTSAYADVDLEKLLLTGSLIGGELVAGRGGALQHVDPSTGAPTQEVSLASADDVGQAVASARAAYPAWRRLLADERRAILLRLADRLRSDADTLSTIAAVENGTPKQLGGLLVANLPADWFAYYAGWCDKIEGRTIPMLGGSPVATADGLNYTVHEPYGVVAAIVPWNAPMTQIGMKVSAALAAGNCVVLKPSELAPFTALRFGELCLEAGIPPGVVNVVVGNGHAGDALVRHRGIGKVTFTGGLPTARRVLEAASVNATPTVMELGGKTANLVFADADLQAVVPQAVMTGTAIMAGQGCACPTRLLVEDSIYDTVVQMAIGVAEAIPIGLAMDPTKLMGPVITDVACQRILGVIDAAKSRGDGRLLSGGDRIGGELEAGFFIRPAIFGDVDPGSPLAQTEVFGPVLSIMRFSDTDDAVKIANATDYGLSAHVWTRDIGRSLRLATDLDVGSVAVNGNTPLSPNQPFGGARMSGFGREGGEAGLLEFLREKNVYVKG
jgi:acyl-CoA reductase-like NAD-dependent aldehyde dehydrogenase